MAAVEPWRLLAKRARRRELYHSHMQDPAYRRRQVEDQKRLWQRDPARRMACYARVRAKQSGVPCDITAADIVIPAVCPVLGIPLVRTTGRQGPSSPTLDRIIPAKGYVRGNVIVVSQRANWIKKDATIEELVRIAQFYKNLLETRQ